MCRPGRAQGLGVQGILENLPGHTIGVKMRVAYVVCRCCCVGSAARVPLSAKSPSRNSKCSSQAVAYDDQVLCHGHFGREIQNVLNTGRYFKDYMLLRTLLLLQYLIVLITILIFIIHFGFIIS